MVVGMKATFNCPLDNAHGNEGLGKLPADSTIRYDVELVSIDDNPISPGEDIQKSDESNLNVPGFTAEEIVDNLDKISEQPKLDTVDTKFDHKSGPEADQREFETECYLDTWYQLLAVLYMLLIYCQLVLFAIFFCTTLSYMTRFFHHIDDVP